jgi:competence protein ComEC
MGIICFHKPIYQVFPFRNPIVKAAWNMSAVTLAAQTLTLPFCLYYFHQFPNYFFFTNFIAVPLSSLVLFGEIMLLFLASWPFAAIWLGKMLGWTITRMNDCMEFFATLPYATWTSIHITLAQGIILLVLIWSTGFALMERSRTGFQLAQVSLALFFILRCASFLHAEKMDALVVYNTYGRTAIDRVQSRRFSFSGDSIFFAQSEERKFMIEPARTRWRCETLVNMPGRAHINLWSVGEKTAIWLQAPVTGSPSHKIKVDVLILSGRKNFRVQDLLLYFEFDYLVLDASVPQWKSRLLAKECEILHRKLHDVKEQGAFVMNAG